MINPDTLLSEHLSVRTFTKSTTALRNNIDNDLPDHLLPYAQKFAQECFEKVRHILGDQVVPFNSGYRSHALNLALPGSAANSQHMATNAMDIDPAIGNVQAFYILISDPSFRYDQIFIEGFKPNDINAGWIHCAYNTMKGGNLKTEGEMIALQNGTSVPEVDDSLQRMEIKIVSFPPDRPKGLYTSVTKEQAIKWCIEHGAK